MNNKLHRIEIKFAAPVTMPEGFDRALAALVGMVCERYQMDNPSRVMWTASFGNRPLFSMVNPEEGPLAFDNTTYQIGCEEREDYYGDNPANPDRERLRKELSNRHAEARKAERERVANVRLTDSDINACIKQSVQPSGLMDYTALARSLESTLLNKRAAPR
jgi:hypothetical protein